MKQALALVKTIARMDYYHVSDDTVEDARRGDDDVIDNYVDAAETLNNLIEKARALVAMMEAYGEAPKG